MPVNLHEWTEGKAAAVAYEYRVAGAMQSVIYIGVDAIRGLVQRCSLLYVFIYSLWCCLFALPCCCDAAAASVTHQ